MLKRPRLRDALVAALPQLQQSPRNIRFTIERGRVVNTGTPSLSWEYRYTLSLVIADFTGSIDAVTVPGHRWSCRSCRVPVVRGLGRGARLKAIVPSPARSCRRARNAATASGDLPQSR